MSQWDGDLLVPVCIACLVVVVALLVVAVTA